MTNFLDEIKKKINKKIDLEEISLIDNSSLHSKHKSFSVDKFHIKIIIKSKKLKNMQKIEAHKVVFSVLKKEMKEKIHALEIVIN